MDRKIDILIDLVKIWTLKQLAYTYISAYQRFCFLVISFFLIHYYAFASETDTLFLSDDIINIEIRSDFSAIQIDRIDTPTYHEGQLIYHTPGRKPTTLSVEVMARGNFRRDTANCNFPPLFLNFKKNEVPNTLFENQDKIKLVTPCHTDDDVIDEYLIYKMYNQITDLSFKVRLVRIHYFDTGSNKELFEKYSFFLEDKGNFSERHDVFEKDVLMTPFKLNREIFNLMSVFQYMIGNKEWFVTTRHNIVIMQPNDSSLAPIAIPYDFDFSGFVNADYTKPKGVPENLLSKRRIYKGICSTDNELNEVFEFYRKLKPVMESLILNCTQMTRRDRKHDLDYINYFYNVIENDKQIKREFHDNCETKKDYGIID